MTTTRQRRRRKPEGLMRDLRSAARYASSSAPGWASLMVQAETCIAELLAEKRERGAP